MDTKCDNAIYVTKSDSEVLQFAPVGKGLYAYTGSDSQRASAWALINTIEEHKWEYTK
jgi:hypothetical protein